jgi:hypothetical protein
MSLDFAYRKSKDIAFDLSSTLFMTNNFVYYKGKVLDFNLDSSLPMSMDFAYRKRKDIGFNLNSNILMTMQFVYGIGNSLFYEINSALSMANNFVYYRSKDIGVDVSATMLMANDFTYRRSKDIGISLDGTLGMSMVMSYETKLSYYSVDGVLSMANSFAYRKSYDIGFSLNSTIPMSMSIAYTKAFNKATAPTISNKAVADVKAWNNSTEIYWNAQDPSNRDTWVGTPLPSASGYAIGFAMRLTDGSFPVTYTYHKVVKTGDSVTWKITNNDEATCTVYCKIGTSSYLNYGTLASGATTGTLSRTVTNGLTTVYAYVVVTGKSNSDVVSL